MKKSRKPKAPAAAKARPVPRLFMAFHKYRGDALTMHYEKIGGPLVIASHYRREVQATIDLMPPQCRQDWAVVQLSIR